jgi:hypothetical protein
VLLACSEFLLTARAIFYSDPRSVDVEMSVHGYIAMILGIVFSLVIGCGLMALMFYSSRHGYDDIDRRDL